MTDVLIVCVREDEVQAKSLADLFEREQMSVGGAPADDAALRGCGAVVVLWSQASIRSRPFLDAAQRAVNANKAVIACLIDAPPASSLNQSPCFDLRVWNGSPDDPLVDPLYFAVDRMVNTQRALQPAEPEQPPAPPAYAAPPPYARARPQPPPATPLRYETPRYDRARREPEHEPEPPRLRRAAAPPPSADGADPVSAEAMRWKAIRHSRDPAAFLHYLAEYGPDGAFSELAELRLKQLQDANATPLKAAARAVAQEQRRAAPPPPEPAPPPPRREPPRREPPVIVAREPDPPPPERHYRERRDYREQDDYRDYAPPRPRRSGGAARVLLLVLLLGGGALGAGWYFANGQRGLEAMGDQAFAEAEAPAAETDPAAAFDPALAAGEQRAVGGPVASEETEPAEVRSLRAPPPERTEARPRFEPVPPPTSSNLELMPRQVAPNPQQLASLDAAAVRPPLVTPGAVVWVSRATAQTFSDQYPAAARRAGVAGRVQLSCDIRADFSPDCTVLSETPQGYGFGQAAVRVSRSFRARPTLDDGAPSAGAQANLNFTFRPAD